VVVVVHGGSGTAADHQAADAGWRCARDECGQRLRRLQDIQVAGSSTSQQHDGNWFEKGADQIAAARARLTD